MPLSPLNPASLALVTALLLSACSADKNPKESGPVDIPVEKDEMVQGNVITYDVYGITFEGPDTAPAGWTTIRLNNESAMIHFAMVESVPDSITPMQHKEVAAVFQNFMDNFNGVELSEPDAGMELPEWFGSVTFMGGPGLVSPGRTAETTIFLEPGNYLIECYVKTDGKFHSYNPDPSTPGMVHSLRVTDANGNAEAPEATFSVAISSEEGIEFEGAPKAGMNVIEVEFLDQTTYENFVGHDVHLIRIDTDTDMKKVGAWMNWTVSEGLQSPAPVQFLGGINEMPAESKGYIIVNLEPGEYAFISEVPDPEEKDLLETFTVTPVQ